MTLRDAEEVAREIAGPLTGEKIGAVNYDRLMDTITAAIHEARREMREVCARASEKQRSYSVAAAIRALPIGDEDDDVTGSRQGAPLPPAR